MPSPARSPCSSTIATACDTSSLWKSPAVTETHSRGSRTPSPAPPGRPHPVQSPGTVSDTRSPWKSPPATDTHSRGFRTPCTPPPGRPHPVQSPGTACDTRSPWSGRPAPDTQKRGCCRPSCRGSAPLSSRRLLPSCPRARAPPHPASRQQRQLAPVAGTRDRVPRSGRPRGVTPCVSPLRDGQHHCRS